MRLLIPSILILLLLSLLSPLSLFAQHWTNKITLHSPDTIHSTYAKKMQWHGDNLLINHLGKKSIFYLKPNGIGGFDIQQEIYLNYSHGSGRIKSFGREFCASEDVLMVSAINQYERNGIYIFHLDSTGTWQFFQELDLKYTDYGSTEFGRKIALQNGEAIITLSAKGYSSSEKGEYLMYYVEDPLTRKWNLKQEMKQEGFPYGRSFGNDIEFNDSCMVAGAYRENEQWHSIPATGGAYVFKRTGEGLWTRTYEIMDPDTLKPAGFGQQIEMAGNTLAIAAPGDDYVDSTGRRLYGDAGAIHIYQADSGCHWHYQAKLMSSQKDYWEFLGTSMEMNDSVLMVGDAAADNKEIGDDLTSSGAVFVFERDRQDNWVEVEKIIPDDLRYGDNYGAQIALSHDKVLIGRNGLNYEEENIRYFTKKLDIYQHSPPGVDSVRLSIDRERMIMIDTASVKAEVFPYDPFFPSIELTAEGFGETPGAARLSGDSLLIPSMTGDVYVMASLLDKSDTVRIEIYNPISDKSEWQAFSSVYPNPTEGEYLNLVIKKKLIHPITITLADERGKVIYLRSYDNNLNDTFQIPFTVPKGIYLLQVQTTSEHVSMKVIKR